MKVCIAGLCFLWLIYLKKKKTGSTFCLIVVHSENQITLGAVENDEKSMLITNIT